jgi:molecular chaperone GrpE
MGSNDPHLRTHSIESEAQSSTICMSEQSSTPPSDACDASLQNSTEHVVSAAAIESETLAHVQAELTALQAKSAELADQYLRAKADAENARRRAEDEISKARKFAVEGFAESLLPVADSLEAGLAIQDATPEQIREGAQATLRQLIAALERNKVVAIAPAPGTKFDPHQHQAISVVPSEHEANAVVGLLQKGYSIADRVLRPALVTVSAPK